MIDNLAALVGDRMVLLALIGCVGVLAWHGTIDGQATIAFLSAIATGGVLGAHRSTALKETKEQNEAADRARLDTASLVERLGTKP